MSTDATSQFFDHPEFDRRATVDEQGLPTAWFGAAESVPWPTPVLPEAVYLSFYGRGAVRRRRFAIRPKHRCGCCSKPARDGSRSLVRRASY